MARPLLIEYQKAHVRNKPGNRRVVWDLDLFRGGKDKWERVEAIGGEQRIRRGDKEVGGGIFLFQALTPHSL